MLLYTWLVLVLVLFFFFFQAEDGIRDLVRSRGLGDVYKRQGLHSRLRLMIFACAVSGGVNPGEDEP